LLRLKNIKKSSVYITPNFPTLETKRYKIKLLSLIGYFILLLITLIIVLSLLFAYTPLNKIVMFLENDKITTQTERIAELEQEVLLLTKELNRISKLDRRLKYAIELAETDTLVDSTAAIYDSLRKTKGNRLPGEGAILFVFENLLQKIFNSNSDSVYFIAPVKAIIGNEFNPEKGHFGVDYLVKEGTPVLAPAAGIIIFAGYTTDNGNVIIIQHPQNYLSVFKHCSEILKTVREDVARGEVIALSGNTGTNTTNAHLHFELWKNSKPINPKTLLIN